MCVRSVSYDVDMDADAGVGVVVGVDAAAAVAAVLVCHVRCNAASAARMSASAASCCLAKEEHDTCAQTHINIAYAHSLLQGTCMWTCGRDDDVVCAMLYVSAMLSVASLFLFDGCRLVGFGPIDVCSTLCSFRRTPSRHADSAR